MKNVNKFKTKISNGKKYQYHKRYIDLKLINTNTIEQGN